MLRALDRTTKGTPVSISPRSMPCLILATWIRHTHRHTNGILQVCGPLPMPGECALECAHATRVQLMLKYIGIRNQYATNIDSNSTHAKRSGYMLWDTSYMLCLFVA